MLEIINWLTTVGFDLFMQLSRLLLDYLKVIAWPTVVLILALVYKRPIVSVLARLRKASGPGYALELDARELAAAAAIAEAAEESAEVSSGTPDTAVTDTREANVHAPGRPPTHGHSDANGTPAQTATPSTPMPNVHDNEIRAITEHWFKELHKTAFETQRARQADLGAVLQYWQDVVLSASRVAELIGLEEKYWSPRIVARTLELRGYMSPDYARIAEGLQSLRNKIVHAKEEVTADVVEDFAATSSIVIQQLEKSRRRILLDQQLNDPDLHPDPEDR